jgi:hypothetical protein
MPYGLCSCVQGGRARKTRQGNSGGQCRSRDEEDGRVLKLSHIAKRLSVLARQLPGRRS